MFISIVYCYTQFCSIQEYTKERKKQSVFENLHERQQQQKNLFTEFDPLSFACSLPYCLNFSCVYLFEFTIISIKKKNDDLYFDRIQFIVFFLVCLFTAFAYEMNLYQISHFRILSIVEYETKMFFFSLSQKYKKFFVFQRYGMYFCVLIHQMILFF